MTPAELQRRLTVLEAARSSKFGSSIVLELPPRRYEPAYPAAPVRLGLFQEIPDTWVESPPC